MMADVALIVGGDSCLGQEIRRVFLAAGFDVWTTSRRSDRLKQEQVMQLDLADPETPPDLLELAPQFVIFSGAMTSQDACKRYPKLAEQINVRSVVRMSEEFALRNSKLLFVSSNAVFDGRAAHTPADGLLSATSLYGEYKIEAERKLHFLNVDVSIVRFSKLSHSLKPLIRQWVQLLMNGDTITPFSDAFIAPIRTNLAAASTLSVVTHDLTGTTQLSATQDISYSELARAVAQFFELPESLIVPTESNRLTDIKFPRHTTLDSARLIASGIQQPGPHECLVDFKDILS